MEVDDEPNDAVEEVLAKVQEKRKKEAAEAKEEKIKAKEAKLLEKKLHRGQAKREAALAEAGETGEKPAVAT